MFDARDLLGQAHAGPDTRFGVRSLGIEVDMAAERTYLRHLART
jgi:hypothetical protein